VAAVDPLLLLLASAVIGLLAAILGLGGGMFLIPLLVLWLDAPPATAAATSLVCCLVTSAAGSVAFDKAQLADLRLVAHLQWPSSVGALAAAWVAGWIPPRVIYGLFAAVLGWAAYRILAKAWRERVGAPAKPADGDEGPPEWPVNYPSGLTLSGLSGVACGLLGIGGGPIRVPLQTEVMRVPLPVALANSNLMVGMTTVVAAAVYYGKGEVLPQVTAPCALGIGVGAYAGGLLAPKLRNAHLAALFGVLLSYVGVQMLWKAIAS